MDGGDYRTAPATPGLLKNRFELKYTRRYSPLCGLTSSSCRGLWPSAEAFFALLAKKGLFMMFVLILGHFWYSVVTPVILGSNLSNFESYPKISTNPK